VDEEPGMREVAVSNDLRTDEESSAPERELDRVVLNVKSVSEELIGGISELMGI
jgi:hypothetical protein